MPALSFLTATFNCIKSGNEETLIRCIESVAKLKIPHEHLILDGASNDGTVELLRDLEVKTSGLRVVSEKDTGIYNALNKGVCDAKGEWLHVLGADDYIMIEENLYDALRAGEKQCADIVAVPVYTSEDKTTLVHVSTARVIGFMPCPHQGIIVKTSVARMLHGFDEKFKIAADYDMLLRALLQNLRIVVRDVGFAFYSQNGISSNRTKCTDENNAVVAKNLGLTDEEISYYARKNILPLGKCIYLLLHPSAEIRLSARYYFLRWIADKIGFLKNDGVLRWH